MLVLPVVVQQLGEDGEVEEGEDEADCLEGDLLDLLTVGRRTQLTPVYVDHLARDLSQSKYKLRLLSLPSIQPTSPAWSLDCSRGSPHQPAWREDSEHKLRYYGLLVGGEIESLNHNF